MPTISQVSSPVTQQREFIVAREIDRSKTTFNAQTPTASAPTGLVPYIANRLSVIVVAEAEAADGTGNTGLRQKLRQNEIRSLIRSSFILTGAEPMVVVEATHTKNKERASIPLRHEMIELIHGSWPIRCQQPRRSICPARIG